MVAPTATAYPEREVIERFRQSRKVEEDAAPFKALAHPKLALSSAFSTYACIIYSRRECECEVGRDLCEITAACAVPQGRRAVSPATMREKMIEKNADLIAAGHTPIIEEELIGARLYTGDLILIIL